MPERLARLRDPAVRRAILDDQPSPALLRRLRPARAERRGAGTACT